MGFHPGSDRIHSAHKRMFVVRLCQWEMFRWLSEYRAECRRAGLVVGQGSEMMVAGMVLAGEVENLIVGVGGMRGDHLECLVVVGVVWGEAAVVALEKNENQSNKIDKNSKEFAILHCC